MYIPKSCTKLSKLIVLHTVKLLIVNFKKMSFCGNLNVLQINIHQTGKMVDMG